jgi:hypothetical protein
MTSHLRKRLDDYMHDLVLVGLPLILCALISSFLYLYLLIKLDKMHASPAVQDFYEARLPWWLVSFSLVFSFFFGGRLTAYVWRKEQEWSFAPPPFRTYRKYGLIFCWSDNLTIICTAIRRIAVMPFAWVNRKRRRIRIRLLWLAHMARSRIGIVRAGIRTQMARAAQTRMRAEKVPTAVDAATVARFAPEPLPVTATEATVSIETVPEEQVDEEVVRAVTTHLELVSQFTSTLKHLTALLQSA